MELKQVTSKRKNDHSIQHPANAELINQRIS